MRVLLVTPKMQLYGGAELLIVRLANYLTKNRIPNGLLTTSLLPEIEKDLTGTHIFNCSQRMVASGRKIQNFLGVLWRLNQELKRLRTAYDVVNVHNFPSEIAVFPYKKPVVWMCNEPPEIEAKLHEQRSYGFNWYMIKSLLAFDRFIVRRFISRIVVADQFNAERFQRLYGVHPTINAYGIDYDFFASPPEIQDTNPSKRFIVLHVGMLTPLKNQTESLKTIEKLKSVIPEIQLVLAGHGEQSYLNQLHASIAAKGLEPYVVFSGHVSRQQLKILYHQSHVLLHPIHSQGGWLSPFEALCAQLPIVVSPQMTASDIILKEDLGAVSTDYAADILNIYNNWNKHKKRAIKQSLWVKDNLSWDRFGDNMLRIFQSALEG